MSDDLGRDASDERLCVRSLADTTELLGHGAVHVRPVFFGADTGFESSLAFVLYNRIAPGQSNERHVHETDEKVYFVVRGEAEVECGPWRRRVRAGDFFFLPAAIEHGIDNVGVEDLELVVVGAHVVRTPKGLSGGGP